MEKLTPSYSHTRLCRHPPSPMRLTPLTRGAVAVSGRQSAIPTANSVHFGAEHLSDHRILSLGEGFGFVFGGHRRSSEGRGGWSARQSRMGRRAIGGTRRSCQVSGGSLAARGTRIHDLQHQSTSCRCRRLNLCNNDTLPRGRPVRMRCQRTCAPSAVPPSLAPFVNYV